MRLLSIAVSAMVVLGSVPTFACGPNESGTSGTTTTIDKGKRHRWAVKRYRKLQGKEEVDHVITILDSRHSPSEEVMRERSRNRLEYLMLKNEMGSLSSMEREELTVRLLKYGVRPK